MKATLSNYRQSPRKVRLVAGLIRGKSVPVALIELDFLNKRSSLIIRKLIQSAADNAKFSFSIDPKNLVIKEIRVDAGQTLKRSMPRARGSAFPIKKRSSHISVVLAEKAVAAAPAAKAPKAKPTTKK